MTPEADEESLGALALLPSGVLADADTGEVEGKFEPPDISGVEDVQALLGRMALKAADMVAAAERVRQAEEALSARVVALVDADPEAVLLRDRLDRARAMRDSAEKQADGMARAWSAPIMEFVQRVLDGKKERTLKLWEGSVSLRTVPPGIEIVDEALAVDWTARNAPDALKVSCLVSKVPQDAWKAPSSGFARRPGRTSVTIEVVGCKFDENGLKKPSK